MKWDTRFLELADLVASWSKDPSTQVGAVIVRPDRTIASLGYNGFPRGIEDDEERLNDRDIKYEIVKHAEENAILNAREPLLGYTIYCTLFPCPRCTGDIIQSGITRVVSRLCSPERAERSKHALSYKLMWEVGMDFYFVEDGAMCHEDGARYFTQDM